MAKAAALSKGRFLLARYMYFRRREQYFKKLFFVFPSERQHFWRLGDTISTITTVKSKVAVLHS